MYPSNGDPVSAKSFQFLGIPPKGELLSSIDTPCQNKFWSSSPFGGIPRNWKQYQYVPNLGKEIVPPSGGSLEIGNLIRIITSLSG